MYSPRIDEELIPTLYRLAKERRIPMTRLVNGMIRGMIRSALEAGGSDPDITACQEKGGGPFPPKVSPAEEDRLNGGGAFGHADGSASPSSFISLSAHRGRDISIVRLQMVREGCFPWHPGPVKHSSDAAKIFRSYLAGADREYFVILLLDGKHKVNALNLVSIGSLSSAVVDPREVFKPALIANAGAAILSHNHPSGDPAPSREDTELTRRLVAAGKLLGVRVLDHIIIGEGEYVSLADKGVIRKSGEGI